MFKFSDLVFKSHPLSNDPNAIQARIDFDNGYGISVIQGKYFYCDKDTYEVAILKDGSLAMILLLQMMYWDIRPNAILLRL